MNFDRASISPQIGKRQSVLINDNRFIHSKSIESINGKESFSYFKSDYFYASYVDEPQGNKTNIIDFTNKRIFSIANKHFFHLFGIQILPIDKTKLNDPGNKAISFLKSISTIKGSQSKFEESKTIWESINLKKSDGKSIEYQNLKFENCELGYSEESIIKWILAFHNFGVEHHINFTFTIFFINYEKYKCSTFSVGKNCPRNRCFVTFLSNSYNKAYEPYILSLFARTNRTKITNVKGINEQFYSISNMFCFFTGGCKKENEIALKENEKYQNWKTIFYNIISKKSDFEPKIKQDQFCSESKIVFYHISSVLKLNCFLRQGPDFQFHFNKHYLKNFYQDSRIIQKDENSKESISMSVSANSYMLATVIYKETNKELSLKCSEYQIYVGLNGIEYEKIIPGKNQTHPFSSHISIFSYLKLQAAFVDENLDKIYCVFTDDYDNNLRLVESDFGTTKLDDMKTVKLIDTKVINPEFKVNIFNHLILTYNSDDKHKHALKQNKNDGSWEDFIIPNEENYFLHSINSREEIKISNCYSTPIALEISNKLFVMRSSTQLYHPAWRNCILRDGIISTFYHFAYNIVPDTIIFDSNDIINAIIYPQIDIGYQGNIPKLFSSTNFPGIYEYSGKDFNYPWISEKNVQFWTKTNFLFFNNGNLKVGLDRHRTKCQIAATALFGFSCTIYGPGIMIRDFCIRKERPDSRTSFQMIHNFLIAAYGTFMKMKNEEEFQFAIDVICEELDIKENRKVYDNIMEELRKNYY